MFATAVRWAAKKGKPKMAPIELTAPPEQAQSITRAIFDAVREHGPLTVSDVWDHVKVQVAQQHPPPLPLSPAGASTPRESVRRNASPDTSTNPRSRMPSWTGLRRRQLHVSSNKQAAEINLCFHPQDVGLRGLASKRQMKIMLRWMRERQKLKLICDHDGPHKQFLYTTWFTNPRNAPQRPNPKPNVKADKLPTFPSPSKQL